MARGWQVWMLASVLGLHLAASLGRGSPRVSFPLGSPDRPLQHVGGADIRHATALLLSADAATLFVGARDAVLSLDVSQHGVMTRKTKVEWKPSPEDIQACSFKGQNKEDCLNFVRVLQHINATHLYACGSYAYNPHDTYIDADSLTMVKVPSKRSDEARGRCPFNPNQRSTAITIDGELFTGTTSDFRGIKPVVSRHLSKDNRPDVSQETSLNLLDEPSFVSSSSDPADNKLYFFFSEVAREYSFLEAFRVSRVAQVCKDDIGGKRVLQKRWTSFAKAQLLCQPPKELPFNVIQDMFTLQPPEGASTKETLFYGVEWKPSPEDIQACSFKGQNKEDCLNFVRVLQHINATHLYACGSYAYNPHDTYIDADSLTMVKVPSKRSDEARGRCPFNPNQRSTAITIDGELFTGTTSDFRGIKPVVSRHLSKDNRPDVSQETSLNLLDEPSFVSSSSDPADNKLYFFFSEVAREYSFLEAFRVSRVAQVCKDDIGGKRVLQKRWTSFAKAQLLCQPPKELPFNVIQDMFTLQPPEGASTKETLFYGVFTSQWSVSGSSALCVFGIEDIKAVFTGNYRTFDMTTHQWSPLTEKNPNLGTCGLSNASDASLMDIRKSFLTSGLVRPQGGVPVLVSPDQVYSRVAAQRTQAANGKNYTVLFLLSESGWLHKAVLLDKELHIIEEVQVFRQPQLMKNILLSTSKGVVFVGTSEGVTQVAVTQCPSYRSCAQCVMARDPFCGWDHASGVCARLPARTTSLGQDVEHGDASGQCEGHDAKAADAQLPSVQIYTQLNKEVRLPCSKPSNLATLIWKSPSVTLPRRLPFLYEEGSLVFLATPDTLGSYRCVSVEGGYEETVARYTVSKSVSPRSAEAPLSRTTADSNAQTKTVANAGESSVSPAVPPMDADETPWEELVTDTVEEDEEMEVTSVVVGREPDRVTSPTKAQEDSDAVDENKRPENKPQTDKDYHSELVAVSCLLAVCVCVFVLGRLYRWRQQGGYKHGDRVTPEGDHTSFEVDVEKETRDP